MRHDYYGCMSHLLLTTMIGESPVLCIIHSLRFPHKTSTIIVKGKGESRFPHLKCLKTFTLSLGLLFDTSAKLINNKQPDIDNFDFWTKAWSRNLNPYDHRLPIFHLEKEVPFSLWLFSSTFLFATKTTFKLCCALFI